MNSRRIFQWIAALAVLAGILWMRSDELDEQFSKDAVHADTDATAELVRSEPAAPVETTTEPPAQRPAVVQTREIPGDPGGPPLVPALPLQRGELPWETTIQRVLADDRVSDPDKARRLLEMLPALPVEGRESAAEIAVKLVTDRDYRALQNVTANPSTYGPALAVLWADLNERSPQVTLPMLLAIARNPSHPYAPNARENLALLVGQDLGTDWPRWEAAVREKLAKEPKR